MHNDELDVHQSELLAVSCLYIDFLDGSDDKESACNICMIHFAVHLPEINTTL